MLLGFFPVASLLAQEAEQEAGAESIQAEKGLSQSEAGASAVEEPQSERGGASAGGGWIYQAEWELGLGGVVSVYPHYPGSNQYSVIGLPFPYITFQWKNVELNRSGLRAFTAFLERWEVSLSGRFSLPAVNNNNAREGMPDLNALAEAGPSLNYQIYEDALHDWQLRLPLRVAVSLDEEALALGYEGFTFGPNLRYTGERLWDDRSSIRVEVGPLFGYDGFNDYFYTVEPRYAAPNRPAFDAQNGLFVSQVALSLQYDLADHLFIFSSWRNLLGYGSRNRASPLYIEDVGISFNLGLVYIFRKNSPERQR